MPGSDRGGDIPRAPRSRGAVASLVAERGLVGGHVSGVEGRHGPAPGGAVRSGTDGKPSSSTRWRFLLFCFAFPVFWSFSSICFVSPSPRFLISSAFSLPPHRQASVFRTSCFCFSILFPSQEDSLQGSGRFLLNKGLLRVYRDLPRQPPVMEMAFLLNGRLPTPALSLFSLVALHTAFLSLMPMRWC